MAKRSSKEMDAIFEDDEFEEMDPKEIVKEKRLKKKPTTVIQQAEQIADEAAGTSSSIFDEILTFSEEQQDKFQKTIQISQTEGIGVTANYVSLLRISKKNGKNEISNYQFTMKNSVIPNLIIALRKVMRYHNENKK
jgi:hypothetical protein